MPRASQAEPVPCNTRSSRHFLSDFSPNFFVVRNEPWSRIRLRRGDCGRHLDGSSHLSARARLAEGTVFEECLLCLPGLGDLRPYGGMDGRSWISRYFRSDSSRRSMRLRLLQAIRLHYVINIIYGVCKFLEPGVSLWKKKSPP